MRILTEHNGMDMLKVTHFMFIIFFKNCASYGMILTVLVQLQTEKLHELCSSRSIISVYK
jgi:hypothetical protein